MTTTLAIFSNAQPNLSQIDGNITTSVPDIQYSSSMETYDIWMNKTYDGEPDIIEMSGSYSDSYSYSNSYSGWYNSTYPDVWIEKETTCDYTETYTHSQNTSIIGNLSNHMILDVYRVDVAYGDNLNLVWMALKNGTQILEQKIYNFSAVCQYEQNYTREYTYTTRLYNNTTDELIDTIYETETVNGNYSGVSIMDDMFQDGDNWTKMRSETIFSMPLILTMQFYTTQNNEEIAMADLIQGQYYFYNDTDEDGIYSLGENETLSTFNMYENAEFQGYMTPYVSAVNLTLITGNSTHSSPHPSWNIPYINMPSNLSVSEMVGNVSFTQPHRVGNTVSWDIEYLEYPIAASVSDKPGKGMMGLFFDAQYQTYLPNMLGFETPPEYEQCSPGDFSYGFDYTIDQDKSDLDYTLGTPKISNASFYNAVQGLGLSIPHYTYFISSETINQTANNAITRPEDLFGFEIGGSPIALLDMANPLKKNYTLYDYPNTGDTTELESIGGTVNQLITSAKSQKVSTGIGGGDYSCLIYALENEVEGDENFEQFTGLYTIATQNYPTWSGEKMVHDPTFTVYYKEQSSSSLISFVPPQDSGQINSYLVIPLFATVVITVSIIIKRSKR
jgi:hypothetical protein